MVPVIGWIARPANHSMMSSVDFTPVTFLISPKVLRKPASLRENLCFTSKGSVFESVADKVFTQTWPKGNKKRNAENTFLRMHSMHPRRDLLSSR